MLFYEIDDDVELRFVAGRYADELCSVVRENSKHLGEWMPWATSDYDIQKAQEFIKIKLENISKESEIQLVIFRENRIIGTISLFDIDKTNKTAEIGYWLAKKAEGKGIITKSSRALLKHGFEELNLNRIVIRCATENFKSQAIPERLGFTKEGVSRQVQWLHDRFVGLAVFSLLEEEWKEN